MCYQETFSFSDGNSIPHEGGKVHIKWRMIENTLYEVSFFQSEVGDTLPVIMSV